MSHPHVARVDEPDGAVVLSPAGEFDISSVDLLRASFADALSPSRCRLVVDLSGMTFLDSMALGSLIAAGKKASGWGGWLRLVAPPANIRRILRVTQVDTVFGLYDTVAEALQHAPSGLGST